MKKQHPYVAQARAFFRVARKFELQGNQKRGDWYRLLAERKLKLFHQRKEGRA